MDEPLTIVTGSCSGIGKAIATRLLEEGHSVVGISRRRCSDRNFDSPNFSHEVIDISNLDSLSACLPDLTEQYSNLSSIVLCAGYGEFGNLEEFSFEQIKRLVDTNLTAQLYFARAFLPRMKRNRRGDLIFIGSESSLSGGRRGATYVASKSGLLGVARSLRQECSASGIRVSIINLGMTRTSFYDQAKFTHGDDPTNYVEPDDVAAMVSALLSLRQGTIIDEIRMTPAKSVIKRRNR